MKSILVIYFTQSGQLLDIARNVVASLESSSEVQVDYHEIQPVEPFDFPWKNEDFYNAFPESFLQIPCELKPPDPGVLEKDYDLIIMAYQVWYLTPSIPINSFLISDAAKKILAGKPVVTLIACRNMWIQAQEKMKQLLANVDANLVGNIALVDRHINNISVITIAQWMLSGKKTRYLGIFPKPGVADRDIDNAVRFGPPILASLLQNDYRNLQDKLLALDAVKVSPYLALTDERGNILFGKWANFIIKKGDKHSAKRKKWIKVFKIYLLFAIWVIAPIVFIVFLLTYLPSIGKIRKDKKYYSSVNQKV
ncbi:dialkylresorcinol condensing enzyme DarA [Flavobacteriaceae bacterium F08102]|nr:dialkylresorcinol condensing enzyme DarA [Flavobacteriaceae bacterium F08102]